MGFNVDGRTQRVAPTYIRRGSRPVSGYGAGYFRRNGRLGGGPYGDTERRERDRGVTHLNPPPDGGYRLSKGMGEQDAEPTGYRPRIRYGAGFSRVTDGWGAAPRIPAPFALRRLFDGENWAGIHEMDRPYSTLTRGSTWTGDSASRTLPTYSAAPTGHTQRVAPTYIRRGSRVSRRLSESPV